MLPIIKEVHPLAVKHVLAELVKRNLIKADKLGNPVSAFANLKRGEGTEVFAVKDQLLVHNVPSSSWSTGSGFEKLIFSEAIDQLMDDVITAVAPAVIAEIAADLRSLGPDSLWK